MRLLITVLACLAMVAGGCSRSGTADRSTSVVVSVASSLSDVMRPLAEGIRQQSGDMVRVNIGPSNALARQIAAGAAVDLFISADTAQMDAVASSIEPGSRVPLLRNALAVAVPEGQPALTSIDGLTDARFRRIAIGDPAAVPAGVYARTYLQQRGIWDRLEPRLIPSGSVRLALAAVESGAADAAIVYRTDLATAKGVVAAFDVPAGDGPPIVYPAAIITTGSNREGARRVMTYLRSADAAAIFTAAGFVPIDR